MEDRQMTDAVLTARSCAAQVSQTASEVHGGLLPEWLSTAAGKMEQALDGGRSAAEICLKGNHRQSYDLNVRNRSGIVHTDRHVHAGVRFWNGAKCGIAEGYVLNPHMLDDLLKTARSRAREGRELPRPVKSEGVIEPRPPKAGLCAERAASRANGLLERLSRTGLRVHTVLINQRLTWSAVVNSEGLKSGAWVAHEQGLTRGETPKGALVDGVAEPQLDGPWNLDPLCGRVEEALDTLNGEGQQPDPNLPFVFCPEPAGPLVTGLAWLFHGNTVSATPGLARAVGKKLFPSVFNVRDEPNYGSACNRSVFDDEGTLAKPVNLVENGRLVNALHCHETAAMMGMPSNGRALRTPGQMNVSAAPVNLMIAPGNDPIPEACNLFTTRLETIAVMKKPGIISVNASGWLVRGGKRIGRIKPVQIEFPILNTFRRLRGVGADVAFLPAFDGCGTPTLTFNPLPERLRS